jgi:hypothetical protein
MQLTSKDLLPATLAIAIASAAAIVAVAPASALTIYRTAGYFPQPTGYSAGATVIDFNDLPSGEITTANFGDVDFAGSNTNVINRPNRRIQIGANVPDSTGASTFSPGSATFTFSDYLPYFGVRWSSLSNTDSISLYRNGTLLESFTGQYLRGLSGGGIYFNFFERDPNLRFDSVVLASVDNPSSIDNVAYQVPTPALLPGLLSLGLASWRKRQQAEQA